MTDDTVKQPGSPWGNREIDPPPDRDFLVSRDVPYRLMRLRRVLIISLAFPLLVAYVMNGFVQGWDNAFNFPMSVCYILGIWSVVSVLMIVFFPQFVVVEVLPGTFATAACLVLPMFTNPNSAVAYFLLIVPWAVAAVLFGFIGHKIALLLPRKRYSLRQTHRFQCDPKTVFEAFSVKPDKRWPGGDTSAVNSNGFFAQRVVVMIYDPEAREFRPVISTANVRIVDEQDLAQSYLIIPEADHDSKGLVSVVVHSDGSGSILEREETYEAIPMAMIISMWLTDAAQDWLRYMVDQVEGRPPRSIKGVLAMGLTTWLAGLLPKLDPNTPPGM